MSGSAAVSYCLGAAFGASCVFTGERDFDGCSDAAKWLFEGVADGFGVAVKGLDLVVMCVVGNMKDFAHSVEDVFGLFRCYSWLGY